MTIRDIEEQNEVTPTPTQETETVAFAMATDTIIPPSSSSSPVHTVATTPVTSTTPSTGVVETPNATMVVPIEDQPRQGSLCCGCCCDFRRAVMIINGLSIVFGVVLTRRVLFVAAFLRNAPYRYIPEAEIKINTATGVLFAISVVFDIVALVGAIKYNIYMVGANMVWVVVSFVLVLIVEWILLRGSELSIAPPIGFLVAAMERVLEVYTHAGFVSQVRAGILTKETYPREQRHWCW